MATQIIWDIAALWYLSSGDIMIKLSEVLDKTLDVDYMTADELELAMSVIRLKEDESEWAERNVLTGYRDILYREYIKRTKLTCSICGKDAAWNTPCVDDQLNVYCDTCAKSSNAIMLYGIGQHLTKGRVHMDAGKLVFVKDGCVLHADTGYHGVKGTLLYKPHYNFMAWTHRGQRSFPLTKSEKLLAAEDPEAILNKMLGIISSGKTRCTDCGKTIDERKVAGHPLFAGCNCSNCYPKHLEKLEDQRKSGHVCSMCHEPYGNCAC